MSLKTEYRTCTQRFCLTPNTTLAKFNGPDGGDALKFSKKLIYSALFDLSRSLEPFPDLPRRRWWCHQLHLKARVLLFNSGYHTTR